MRDFRIVFGVLMRQRLRVMFQTKAGSKAGRVTASIFVGLAFLILAAFWSVACYFLFTALAASGNAELGLFGAFLVAMVMTLFFCIASVVGTLFAAQDAELLMALPLRPGAVFMARFAFVYFGELAIAAFIALPALVCFIIATGGGVWAALTGAVVILLLPALPLAVAALLSLLLMRSAVFMRHREMFMTVFGVVFAISFSLGGQLFGQTVGRMDESQLIAMMSGAESVLSGAARVFPPAAWAAEAVAASGGFLAAGAKGLMYILVCGAGLALTGFVGARTYFKSASAMKESAKRSPDKARLRGESMRRGSALRACLLRETRSVMRSATYAMNCLLGVVMFPLMFAIMPLIMSASIGEEAELIEGVGAMQVFSVLLDGVPAEFIFAGALAVMMFSTFANIAASTAISREGEQLAQVKAMPLKMSTLCFGKLIFSAAANALTVLLTAAVIIVLLPKYVGAIVLAAAAGCIAGVGTAALGMLVDALRPKLKWQNEAEAVKQNVNGVFGMLLNLLMGAIVCVPVVIAAIGAGFIAAAALAIGLGAALSALGVWALGRAADRALTKV